MIEHNPAIVVFLKSPSSRYKKTRLAAELGQEDANRVYEILVKKILKLVDNIDFADKWISLSAMEEQDLKWFYSQNSFEKGWKFFEQKGQCIGERMHNTFCYLSNFYSRTLLVGGDIVDISVDDLIIALNNLEDRKDAVVGPSADGGFWCLGLCSPIQNLFRGIDWSTDNVFLQLKKNVELLGLRIKTVTIRRDIDTCYDIGMTTLLS